MKESPLPIVLPLLPNWSGNCLRSSALCEFDSRLRHMEYIKVTRVDGRDAVVVYPEDTDADLRVKLDASHDFKRDTQHFKDQVLEHLIRFRDNLIRMSRT